MNTQDHFTWTTSTSVPHPKDLARLRLHCVDLATRVNLDTTGFNNPVEMARAFEEYIISAFNESQAKETTNAAT